MVLIILSSVTGGFLSGFRSLNCCPENAPGRFRILTASFIPLMVFIMAGFSAIPLLRALVDFSFYYYTSGMLVVISGLNDLGIINLIRSVKNSGFLLPKTEIIRLFAGNMLFTIVIASRLQLSFLPATGILLLFIFSYIVGRMLHVLLCRRDDQSRNRRDLAELAGLLNGIYLVIAGLLVFSNQIEFLDKLSSKLLTP